MIRVRVRAEEEDNPFMAASPPSKVIHLVVAVALGVVRVGVEEHPVPGARSGRSARAAAVGLKQHTYIYSHSWAKAAHALGAFTWHRCRCSGVAGLRGQAVQLSFRVADPTRRRGEGRLLPVLLCAHSR